MLTAILRLPTETALIVNRNSRSPIKVNSGVIRNSGLAHTWRWSSTVFLRLSAETSLAAIRNSRVAYKALVVNCSSK